MPCETRLKTDIQNRPAQQRKDKLLSLCNPNTFLTTFRILSLDRLMEDEGGKAVPEGRDFLYALAMSFPF